MLQKWSKLTRKKQLASKDQLYSLYDQEFKFQNLLLDINSPGVNFTNILRAVFSYESFARAFLCLKYRLNFFGANALIKCWWNWPQTRSKLLNFRVYHGFGFWKIIIINESLLKQATFLESAGLRLKTK